MKNSGKWRTKTESAELRRLRSSSRWQRLRLALLLEHPVCEVCVRAGRPAPRPAEEVHHICPAQQMIDRFGDEGYFARENLACVCEECHVRNERAFRDGLAAVVFGKEGGTWQG